MQNKYVGDAADFVKSGLLRWLCGLREETASDVHGPLKLGVVWYLNENDDRNTGNIDPPDDWRDKDRHLFDALRSIRGTNVREFRKKRIFPDAHFYEDLLTPIKVNAGNFRNYLRKDWFEGALKQTSRGEIVFVDPDIGISNIARPFRNTKVEYVYMEELYQFTRRGQGLVIFHNLGRAGTQREQIQRFSKSLYLNLKLTYRPWVLWHKYGGIGRAFFIVAQTEKQQSIIRHRLTSFRRRSRWWTVEGQHIAVFNPNGNLWLPNNAISNH